GAIERFPVALVELSDVEQADGCAGDARRPARDGFGLAPGMAEAAVCSDRDMDLHLVHWILLCDLVEELCLADLSAVSALAEHVGPAWRSRDRDGGGLSRAPVELMRSPAH